MSDLSTSYLGLQLENPVIVSSSSLTNKIGGVRSAAEAGAGAIVLKSLFEEQIREELRKLEDSSNAEIHPEAMDYIQHMGENYQSEDYLNLISSAKNSVDIPVIASLNCISTDKWVSFGKDIEAAGADAIELNIAIMPDYFDDKPEELEQRTIQIVKAVKQQLKIPVAVKLGPYFTSLPSMVRSLEKAGMSGLVLFNRFYRPDIDIEKLQLTSAYRYSAPEEISLPLRWIGLLYGRVGCDIAGSTGVYDGNGVIKHILAGASAVQICSTIYVNGFRQIGIIKDRLKFWMQEHRYQSLSDFRGIMSQKNASTSKQFERLQYIKALVGIE
jgi:dihydroorotate dehydrogenase (fumarate)